MKNIIVLLSVVFVVSFEACVPKSIDIDVKPADPELSVASIVLGNNGIVVSLTRSYSPLQRPLESDTSSADTLSDDLLAQILVANATVTLSYGAQVDTLIEISPGIYTNLLTTITEGETYTLRAVDHDMNLSVWAVTTMQTPAQMDTVYPHINRTAADTIVYFKYIMFDNVNTVDYYVVNFVKKVQGDTTFDINSVFAAGSNEVLTEFELYDDQAFENGVLDRDIAILSAGQTDTVAVSVSKITQGYYEFLTALKRSSSIFNQLTGEPITYPSNVDGGHGYFTMHRTENFIFDLNLY